LTDRDRNFSGIRGLHVRETTPGGHGAITYKERREQVGWSGHVSAAGHDTSRGVAELP